jgi:hypothetical protein
MSVGSRAMIGAVVGLLSLMLALVLGTLVRSAYGFFASQKADVESLCARALELDLAFRQYGAETPLRERRGNRCKRPSRLFAATARLTSDISASAAT